MVSLDISSVSSTPLAARILVNFFVGRLLMFLATAAIAWLMDGTMGVRPQHLVGEYANEVATGGGSISR
jgi:hypothetical protein